MRISIAERLHPFSHRPGVEIVLPGSSYALTVFPTKVLVLQRNEACVEILWGWDGPVDDFTVVQDLERGEVVVFGNSKQGYFRYRITALIESGVCVAIDKLPKEVKVTTTGWTSSGQPWEEGSVHLFGATEKTLYKPPQLERLSLGSHKAQEWERMASQLDFATLLPIWHRLGQMVPTFPHEPLFDRLQAAVTQHDRLQVLERLKEIYLFAFNPCLFPRRNDPFFQGINLPEVKGTLLAVLSEGAALIRSLFVQQDEQQISLLPASPPDFHAGRLLDVPCGNWGHLSFEWSKKEARRAILHATQEKTIALQATPDQHACRVRTSTKDRGAPYRFGSPLRLEAGRVYWFDCFTH